MCVMPSMILHMSDRLAGFSVALPPERRNVNPGGQGDRGAGGETCLQPLFISYIVACERPHRLKNTWLQSAR